MNSVSVTRQLNASPAALRDAILDLEPFMRAAGFDEVEVDGDTIHVANQVGPIQIELTLALVDNLDAVLTYEQREGIFETMRTTYMLIEDPEKIEIVATTDFALDLAVVGSILDATVIKRQRRIELEAQFDYLESTTR
ncbi:SRPBCC family protein [Halomarina pelagica]|uniref:SRPBCC family protein n=1 Tax=Halomarina pelagica TaxID=2961599 RepID=UPI0020C521D2|nr:SRPBCC family protein [Halomarina sp. BND7]